MSSPNAQLLKLIPASQLKRHQHQRICYKDGDYWPTYKFLRAPESLEELVECHSIFSILQETNDTRILVGPLQEIGSDAVSFEAVDAKNPGGLVTLADDDRCLFLMYNHVNCTIVGKSDVAVAETAAFLWSLQDESWRIEICCSTRRFNFSVVSLDQLNGLFQTHPNVRIKLDVTNISLAQSRFLAEYPDRIDLILDLSAEAFADGGDTFVHCLRERKSSFGALVLFAKDYTQNENFRLLLQAEAIDKLVLPYVGPQQQIHLIFSALVAEVDLTIEVDAAQGLDWSRMNIVPKELTIAFKVEYDSEAHTDCVCSFFRRLAELGDFVKLDFDLCYESDSSVPSRVVTALIDAIDANQNLQELALYQPHGQVTPYLQDIFAAVARHEGLEFLRLDAYPAETDPQYNMLKELLKTNRNIQVIDYNWYTFTDDDEIDRLYAFNDFFGDCQDLLEESMELLPSLVGEILTQCASHDFRRSAFLMANHTEALCELMQYSF
ncbi:hypothetical protein FisN_12Lu108 [Fistulifera solaris]|uniref:Uncharacterized protein n=1 Tax=Fistulifera solaris TaxID=1519565 RepID=A0A1Z5K574_FISSO|nr:hypothetical protein FisN_12Lu108 [Fistulifera solaris]|eukprot:GAX21374.1 hypothetical protein FisN_12Lu108 [Fistulifera solaris]